MDEFEAMFAELREAHTAHPNPDIRRIRVTPAAIRGSIAIVPVTAERERLLRGSRSRSGPGPREALIHPEDWYQMLKVIPKSDRSWSVDVGITEPHVFGIPVEVES